MTTPTADPVQRFRAGMEIDYEKWHDGVGYDLDALEGMTPEQLRQVERILLDRGVSDWRDLEALDRLKTPAAIAAIAAILEARTSPDEELRLAAHDYGPKPLRKSREDAILQGLESEDLYKGLSKALDLAFEHPTPRVREALFRHVRDRRGSACHGSAAVLYALHGKMESPDDWDYRPLFLRLAGDDDTERRAAFREFCATLGLDRAGHPKETA